jgi:hypothetical protein
LGIGAAYLESDDLGRARCPHFVHTRCPIHLIEPVCGGTIEALEQVSIHVQNSSHRRVTKT